MGRYKYAFDEADIARWKKQGRGQGQGNNYRPWIEVQNLPSRGNVYRINSIGQYDRIYHLMSQLEYFWFLVFDWSYEIIDIREQFPLLPQSDTLRIAENLNIKHPAYKGQNVVLTSDFHLTRKGAKGQVGNEIYTIKYSTDLDSLRTREKFEIEKTYWAERKIPWQLLTEAELNRVLVRNIQILRAYKTIHDRIALSVNQFKLVSNHLTEEVLASETRWLNDILADSDKKFSLPDGGSLTVAYYLLANRIWQVDLYQPLHVYKRIILQSYCLENLQYLNREISK